ncbi:MAG: LPS export ABC transporter permease LptF [Desulfoferrobacter sp.]
MKPTLYKYLVKEQFAPLLSCLLGLSLVLATGQLIQLIRYLFSTSVSFLGLIEVIGLAMPQLVLYALPMATIMGVLLGFIRLNGDNEIIALKAAGVSFRQFLPAVLSVLILTSVFSLANSIYAVPRANRALQNKLISLGRTNLSALLRQGVFIDLIPNVVFFFKNVSPSDLSIQGIFVQDQRNNNISAAIVAKRAQISYQHDLSQLVFNMQDGSITRVSKDLNDCQKILFKTYQLSLPLDEIVSKAATGSRAKREMMTLAELQSVIAERGIENTYSYALELHKRFALPISCLLLGLVGAPLGALFPRAGRMTGVAIALSLFVAYYVLLSAGSGLGKNGIIPCYVAVWIPNFVTLIIALFLWNKAHRDSPFKVIVLYNHLRECAAAMSKAIRPSRKHEA